MTRLYCVLASSMMLLTLPSRHTKKQVNVLVAFYSEFAILTSCFRLRRKDMNREDDVELLSHKQTSAT